MGGNALEQGRNESTRGVGEEGVVERVFGGGGVVKSEGAGVGLPANEMNKKDTNLDRGQRQYTVNRRGGHRRMNQMGVTPFKTN